VAILSRRPILPGAVCTLHGAFARAVVNFGGTHVEVAALHLAWPWPFDQQREIDSLVPVLGQLSGTALLAGDLNATPWSIACRRVAEAGRLVRVGPAGPTWLHRKLPDVLRPVGLPIDHVFAKGDVLVHSARTLEPAGSDHLPILVEFSLEMPAPGDGTATVRLAHRAAAPRA
jgi:endonuclease/exonuclease/phosphatase (EEP) superfamily protein YafD